MNYDPILGQYSKPFHFVMDKQDKSAGEKEEATFMPVTVVRLCEFPACWHQYSVWKDAPVDLRMITAIHSILCPMKVLNGRGSQLSDKRWGEVGGSAPTGDLFSHLKYGFLNKVYEGEKEFKFRPSRFAASNRYEKTREFMNTCYR